MAQGLHFRIKRNAGPGVGEAQEDGGLIFRKIAPSALLTSRQGVFSPLLNLHFSQLAVMLFKEIHSRFQILQLVV